MHEHELYRRIPKMEEKRNSDYVIQCWKKRLRFQDVPVASIFPTLQRPIIFARVAGHVWQKGWESAKVDAEPEACSAWVGNGIVASTRVHPRGCRRWQRPPAQGGGDAKAAGP